MEGLIFGILRYQPSLVLSKIETSVSFSPGDFTIQAKKQGLCYITQTYNSKKGT